MAEPIGTALVQDQLQVRASVGRNRIAQGASLGYVHYRRSPTLLGGLPGNLPPPRKSPFPAQVVQPGNSSVRQDGHQLTHSQFCALLDDGVQFVSFRHAMQHG